MGDSEVDANPEQHVGPIRGAIKVAITASTESLIAGDEFSIFVTVQNPFEVPLKLIRVSTYLPTEFIDVDKSIREKQATDLERQLIELEKAKQELDLPSASFIPKYSRKPFDLLSSISKISVNVLGVGLELSPSKSLGPAVARDVSSSREKTYDIQLPLIGSIARSVKEGTEQADEETKLAWSNHLAEESKKYSDALVALANPDSTSTKLQAGNSTTRVFTVRTRRGMGFKPASYRLQIEVEYEIVGLCNIDTIEHHLPIKASLGSMILGALIGGIGGWLTSQGSLVTFDIRHALSLVISVVFAAMTVVLFARKKDAQPLIAIEDFWGGVAVGFLVAYSGPKVISGLLGLPGGGSPK